MIPASQVGDFIPAVRVGFGELSSGTPTSAPTERATEKPEGSVTHAFFGCLSALELFTVRVG